MSPAVAETSAPPSGPASEATRARAAGALGRAARWSFVLFAFAVPVATAPRSIAAGLCGALTLAAWMARAGGPRVSTPIDLPAIGWLAGMGLATLFALDPVGSIEGLGKGLIPLVAGVAAWHAGSRVTGVAAVAALMVSGSVVSMIGFARFLAAGGHFPAARAVGFNGTWMTFSDSLLLITSLACGVAIAARRPAVRLAAIGAAVLSTVGLVTSYSRSAWIGLVASLAVVLGYRRPRFLVALAALAALAYFALPGELGDRLRSAFDPGHAGNRDRALLWEAGARLFREYWLTGVGLQDLTGVLQRLVPDAVESHSHVHSSYLQAAVATGIIGLVPFLLLCMSLLRSSLPAPREARRMHGLGSGVRLGVGAGTVGFLVAALFDHPFGDEQLLFLLFSLAGIAWAARGWEHRAEAPGPAAPPAPARGTEQAT